jgi:hypothetical protein
VTAAGPRPPWLPDADADPELAGVVAAALVGDVAPDDELLPLLLQPAAASAASARTETPRKAGLRPFLNLDTLDLPPR